MPRRLSTNRWKPRQVLECASLVVLWRFGDGGEPTESARGLAQSKTLPRDPQVHGPNACEKRKGAFHEPQGRAGCPQPAEPRHGEDTAPYQLAWFMVPMHAEKKRKEALHEAYKSRARACVESGGGPPHSKTLA